MRRQALLALLSWVAVSLVPTPKASGDETQAARLRPLSGREGRAIVQEMAWADDEEGLAPDCSHLVHHLYEQAGYPYPYASSLDLYRGTGPFLRVRTPQPGDLIVWRGHVGIVVNPREHSFFSSVSSGTQIENYRSAYWRARGYARFYRYLTSSPLKSVGKTKEAANRPPEPQPKAQADRPAASDKPNLQAVKSAPAAAGKAHGDGSSSKLHAEATTNATATKAHGEAMPTSATATENSVEIPLRIAGKQPKVADVTSALEAANLDAGEILRAGDLERLERAVVVYRDLQVSAVEVKGKRATAQVQLETVAILSPERTESQKGWEDHTLELQHTKKGWVMITGNQNVYVRRDSALRILASRLSALTQNTDRGTEKEREQADIIRFLNLLVE
jgi:cell wall-associated NlpC family hydrolase